MAQSNKHRSGSGVATAALAAAAAAASASYYFYATKNAKKHRQAASAWARGMRKEVLKRAKSVKKIDAKTVARIVDDAAATYQSVRGATKGDVATAARELKRNWARVKAELEPSPALVRKAKKLAKKVTKQAPAKKKKRARAKKRAS